MALPSYRRHRFPPEIIQNAIWLYLRFTLSYRDVEELLAERGLDISYEGIELVSLREKCGPLSGDRGFESGFLQRRVSCEPDFLDQGTDRASCDRPAPEVAATGAPREGGDCWRCAFSSGLTQVGKGPREQSPFRPAGWAASVQLIGDLVDARLRADVVLAR